MTAAKGMPWNARVGGHDGARGPVGTHTTKGARACRLKSITWI